MNHKAQFELRKAIYWMLAGIVITIIILAFALVLATYKNRLINFPGELPAELISLRFTNNPNCFAYQDPETGRVFPGVIDLTKFTKDNLLDCYQTKKLAKTEGYKEYYNFRLFLKNRNQAIETDDYRHADDYILTKKVVVRNGKEIKNDILEIFVQEKI